MARLDSKDQALTSLLQRAPAPGWAAAAELVEVPAGSVAAPAGSRGRWVTAVVSGSVSTTVPPRRYLPGQAVEHDATTALITATGAVLVTADARHEVARALLAACGSSVRDSSPAPLGESLRS